MEIDEIFA